jgi:hypothetical protein
MIAFLIVPVKKEKPNGKMKKFTSNPLVRKSEILCSKSQKDIISVVVTCIEVWFWVLAA